MTARSPDWLRTAARRDLHASAIVDLRKRQNVDLCCYRFIGLVRDPMSIGRNLGVTLVEWRADQRSESPTAGHGEEADVLARAAVLFPDEQARTVGRERHRKLDMVRRRQPFGMARRIDRLPEDVCGGASIYRRVDYAAAVDRPDWE